MGWEGERASKINEIWMLERETKSLKNWWFSMLKSMRIEKNTLRKTPFFSLLFCNRFWEGLGRVLGGFCKGFGDFWGLLGQFLASFFQACIQNALQKGSWKVLSWILAPYLWIIWAYCLEHMFVCFCEF